MIGFHTHLPKHFPMYAQCVNVFVSTYAVLPRHGGPYVSFLSFPAFSLDLIKEVSAPDA